VCLARPARRSIEGVIVESTPSFSVDRSDSRQPVEPDPAEPLTPAPRQASSAADLPRLMALAGHYARQLVAAANTPPEVLLIEHHGDLDIVMLDRPEPNVAVLRRLLAQHEATSAVLLVDVDSFVGGQGYHQFSIVGETRDGARDERHYRVRPCGRTRRLTRLLNHDVTSVASLAQPLFVPDTIMPVQTA
jgi:hypothetical protein